MSQQPPPTMAGDRAVMDGLLGQRTYVLLDYERAAAPRLHYPQATDEEETVATVRTPKREVDAVPGANKPSKKRCGGGYNGLPAEHLGEGLDEFAAVIARIEKTKTELMLALERQRAEQEERRARLEAERTRIIMETQLEMARLFDTTKSG